MVTTVSRTLVVHGKKNNNFKYILLLFPLNVDIKINTTLLEKTHSMDCSVCHCLHYKQYVRIVDQVWQIILKTLFITASLIHSNINKKQTIERETSQAQWRKYSQSFNTSAHFHV